MPGGSKPGLPRTHTHSRAPRLDWKHPPNPFFHVNSMDPRDFFKNLTGVYGWAAERPGLMFGAGAAALAAPLFMKNDERGYFKTSTMTTPAIIAAAMVAPRLIPTAVSEGKRLIDVVKQVPTDYGFRDGVYQADTGAVNIA